MTTAHQLPDRPRRTRTRRLARGFNSLLLSCTAVALFSHAITEQGAATPPPQPGQEQAYSPDEDTDRPAYVPGLPPAAPQRIRIAAIGVDAPLTGLDLEKDGRLASPTDRDANLAGWYRGGPTPGATGTAVIAGHVDIPTGPAVFYGLGALKKGMHIEIPRADGRTAHFTIDAIEVYDAAAFPDNKVYADRDRPELRVITCGGGYDARRGRYRGNVVVFAHLTAPPGASTHGR
ncbi:class F sortase [Streptomyces sp. NPDC050418]|uniref:class F sortase n=1 Tax=Streptomyces sp. NPDC050418 TaxID=3365612 RepID=UPI0037A91820